MAIAGSVSILEPVSHSNFFPQGYLLANEDLRRAGIEPNRHFIEHGQFEDRQQFSHEIIGPSEYRDEKFKRFAQFIIWEAEPNSSSFPISVGRKHFNLDDYEFESGNESFGPFVREIENNPEKNFLDLGCGLRRQVYENCLYLEVYPSISADLIVSADCVYPIADRVFDGIGCFAVLEHTRKPWLVVNEMHRMLKHGGKAFIDWPFLQPVHGYPSHYFNATREGLESIFLDNGFAISEIKTYPFQGPDYTIAWVLGKFVRSLPDDKREEMLSMTVSELLSHAPEDGWWEDKLRSVSDATISKFACGNCLTAVKL